MTPCVSFKMGGEGFGIPLDQVREIAAIARIAPVPMAPRAIKGIAAWRGRVVTLIDVATLFDRSLPRARSFQDQLAILLAEPFEHVGLFVHAPVEIRQAAAAAAPRQAVAAAAGALDDSAPAPAASPASAAGGLLHLLSAADLVAHCEQRVAARFRRRS